jgi:hypothetical protein
VGDDRHLAPGPAFINWEEVSGTFCLGWPMN